MFFISVLCRRNRSGASDSGYSYTFLHSVVCLSVVRHTRAPFLNRSTDLDDIWQVHLIVLLRVPDPRGRRYLKVEPPAKLEIAAATWRIETRSDSAFSQITLGFLTFKCIGVTVRSCSE